MKINNSNNAISKYLALPILLASSLLYQNAQAAPCSDKIKQLWSVMDTLIGIIPDAKLGAGVTITSEIANKMVCDEDSSGFVTNEMVKKMMNDLKTQIDERELAKLYEGFDDLDVEIKGINTDNDINETVNHITEREGKAKAFGFEASHILLTYASMKLALLSDLYINTKTKGNNAEYTLKKAQDIVYNQMKLTVKRLDALENNLETHLNNNIYLTDDESTVSGPSGIDFNVITTRKYYVVNNLTKNELDKKIYIDETSCTQNSTGNHCTSAARKKNIDIDANNKINVLKNNFRIKLKTKQYLRTKDQFSLYSSNNFDNVEAPPISLPRNNYTLKSNATNGWWGNWGNTELCPEGQFVHGYRLKSERMVGNDDDTGLNAIELQCKPRGGGQSTQRLTSSMGLWGGWGAVSNCPSGQPVTGFKMKIEEVLGSGHDDTAANNVYLFCGNSHREISAPVNTNWGSTTPPLHCPSGMAVIGLKTRVEPHVGDDTAMNGLQLICGPHREYVRIENLWKKNKFIHNQNGKIEYGSISEGWFSAQWKIVPVGNSGYVRFQNKWYPTKHLHIENGHLQVGEIQNGWSSAQWKLEPVGTTGYLRIRNKSKNNQYIHNQNGYIESGNIEKGWWSAQWVFQ